MKSNIFKKKLYIHILYLKMLKYWPIHRPGAVNIQYLVTCIIHYAITCMFHAVISFVLYLFTGITVLLSLTVFMLLVAEIMPATSDSIPLIGKACMSVFVNILKELFIQICCKNVQDVQDFVSSTEQIWRNLAFHHFLTNGSSAVNGCRQNESPDS